MIEMVHTSSLIAILMLTFSFIGAKALIPQSIGRFPFLMPNVHPHQVRVFSPHLLVSKVWSYYDSNFSCESKIGTE